MKILLPVLLGLILWCSTCFAIRPEDMEPNKWYETIPCAPSIRALTCYPGVPGLFFGVSYYRETNSFRLVKSSDYAKIWKEVTSFPFDLKYAEIAKIVASRIGSGIRIYVVSFDRDSNVCIVFISDDEGITWRQMTLPPSTVLVSPSPFRNLIVGLQNPEGHKYVAFWSEDDGVTWTTGLTLDYPNGGSVTSVSFSPHNFETVLLGTTFEDRAIMRSTDSGRTWTTVATRDQWGGGIRGMGFRFHPTKPDCIFTVASSIRVSYDQGVNWSWLNSDATDDLIVFPENPDCMLACDRTCKGIIKTTDAGMSWQTIAWAIPSYLDDRRSEFELSPWELNCVYQVSDTIICSRDFGVSWQAQAPSTFNSVGFVSWNDPNLMLIGDQGAGRFRSQDGGLTWESLPCFFSNLQLQSTEILEIRGNPDVFLFTEDFLECSGYSNWEGRVFRSTDRGTTWELRQSDLGERIRQITPSKTHPNRLFAVADNRPATEAEMVNWMCVSDDEGLTWRKYEIPGMKRIKDIEDSFMDPSMWLVLGCQDTDNRQALLYRSTDSGVEWEEIGFSNGLKAKLSFGLNCQHWDDILIDKQQENRIYILDFVALYISEDAGKSWNRTLEFKYTHSKGDILISPHNSCEMYAPTGGSLDFANRTVDCRQNWSDSTFPIRLLISPSRPNVIYKRDTLEIMRIESTSPVIQMGGFCDSNLKAGEESRMSIAFFAADPDLNDAPTRIDLYDGDISLNYSIRDDALPGSGLFVESVDCMPSNPCRVELNGRAVDKFGNVSAPFPLIRIH